MGTAVVAEHAAARGAEDAAARGDELQLLSSALEVAAPAVPDRGAWLIVRSCALLGKQGCTLYFRVALLS